MYLDCEKECNVAVDCQKYPYYTYRFDGSDGKFDYNIASWEINGFRCIMIMIICIFSVIIFIVANCYILKYETTKLNVIIDKLREYGFVRI